MYDDCLTAKGISATDDTGGRIDNLEHHQQGRVHRLHAGSDGNIVEAENGGVVANSHITVATGPNCIGYKIADRRRCPESRKGCQGAYGMYHGAAARKAVLGRKASLLYQRNIHPSDLRLVADYVV